MPGILLQKCRQLWNDQLFRYGDGHINPQTPADAGGVKLKHAVQLFKIAEQVSGAFVINHTILRQLYPGGLCDAANEPQGGSPSA
ncbi:Uncharacterised protein [Klebsiella michiganensis]|uniref:Uncharacterized protein n=1 Tax=Klebsiella michiganensis TaxID=1134687 RepID=A0A7H4M4B0_9ENTR|nr:Uncharacterised protein [Klebsiella michiganensis]